MYRPGKRRSRLGSGFAALAVFLLVAVANAAETSQPSYGPKVGDRRDHSQCDESASTVPARSRNKRARHNSRALGCGKTSATDTGPRHPTMLPPK